MTELTNNSQAISLRDELKSFKAPVGGKFLNFSGVESYDVYNPSIPFESCGKTIIAGRVEKRSNELSQTMFFENQGESWVLIPEAPTFELQDPFVTFITGELWLGGVYVEWDGKRLVKYFTKFYHGKNIYELKFAFDGPMFMKDIRLLELRDGRIAVFSRPQGDEVIKKYGCIAKIGFDIADSVSDIDADFIENAPFIEGLFTPEEWGGANQLHDLGNNRIGVVGHKACGEMQNGVHIIHYVGMSFVLDIMKRRVSEEKLLASRKSFPTGEQKDARSADVVFSSGIIRKPDATAELYAGLSDCRAGVITIADPFQKIQN